MNPGKWLFTAADSTTEAEKEWPVQILDYSSAFAQNGTRSNVNHANSKAVRQLWGIFPSGRYFCQKVMPSTAAMLIVIHGWAWFIVPYKHNYNYGISVFHAELSTILVLDKNKKKKEKDIRSWNFRTGLTPILRFFGNSADILESTNLNDYCKSRWWLVNVITFSFFFLISSAGFSALLSP